MSNVDTSQALHRWKTEQWKPGDTLYLVEIPGNSAKRTLGEEFTLLSISSTGHWAHVLSKVTGKSTNFYPRRFSKFYSTQMELFDEP